MIPISDNNRGRTPPFLFSFPQNNIYAVKEGKTTGVGDGFWICKALPPGLHTIITNGACMSGRVQIDVEINVTVIYEN